MRQNILVLLKDNRHGLRLLVVLYPIFILHLRIPDPSAYYVQS